MSHPVRKELPEVESGIPQQTNHRGWFLTASTSGKITIVPWSGSLGSERTEDGISHHQARDGGETA